MRPGGGVAARAPEAGPHQELPAVTAAEDPSDPGLRA